MMVGTNTMQYVYDGDGKRVRETYCDCDRFPPSCALSSGRDRLRITMREGRSGSTRHSARLGQPSAWSRRFGTTCPEWAIRYPLRE